MGVHHLSVGVEFDRNAVRPFSVRIIIVHPGLAAGDRGRLRGMGIRDGESVGAAAGDLRPVFFHRILFHSVFDCLAVRVFVTGREAPLPAAVAVQVISRRHVQVVDLHAVRVQVQGDVMGPDSVLVVRVIPGLGPGNLDLLGRVAVGDHEGIRLIRHPVVRHIVAADRLDVGGLIIRHVDFDHGIFHRLPVLVHGDILHRVGPLISVFADRCAFLLRADGHGLV